MQESPQLKEERKLERRGWLGCLLAFAIAGVIMALVTALPQSLFPSEPAQPSWLALISYLLPMVATLVVGIAGLMLMLRLLSWSSEAERRRHQRGTTVFRQMLPGLNLGRETSLSTPAISFRQLFRLLLLFLLYVAVAIFAIIAVGEIIERALPSAPGIVGFIFTIAVFLGVLFLGERALERRWVKPGTGAETETKAPARERKPGRSRMAGAVIYLILALVPVIGILMLVLRIPAPVLLMPILALGICTVVFMAVTAVYIIVPFLWISRPVKRGDYDRAIARAQLIERLSVLPGFYLNQHGVILLWAGRYEEARTTFEESIGEQSKEVMGGGSAALENIGCVLAWQGRYEEAIKMFEGSIAITQQQAMVYSDLAEALLHLGIDLPRALESTERAWANQQASFEARWLSPHQSGQILANRAWALALLGRSREADEALARAFAVADKSFRPVFAGIHLRAGYVMLARGERSKADDYFRKGIQLDPHGHYGRLCTEAMQPGSNT